MDRQGLWHLLQTFSLPVLPLLCIDLRLIPDLAPLSQDKDLLYFWYLVFVFGVSDSQLLIIHTRTQAGSCLLPFQVNNSNSLLLTISCHFFIFPLYINILFTKHTQTHTHTHSYTHKVNACIKFICTVFIMCVYLSVCIMM